MRAGPGANVRIVCSLLGVLLLPMVRTTGAEQANGLEGVPTANEIAALLHQRNQERNAALLSYESRRVMTLEYKGLLASKRATETVQMVFTAPGTKRFTVISNDGAGMLGEGVFAREMDDERAAADPKQREAAALIPANYTLRLLGVERLPEGECYVLEVAPRHGGRFVFSGRVWVQSTDFAVVKIEAVPQENPSFLVHDGAFTALFGKVGEFWLPKETVSNSRIRLGGRATFSIEFGPYRILETRPLHAAAEHP